MRFQICFILLSCCLSSSVYAQFHTLRMPQASNAVEETQQLGVTDITIKYHSPAVRGRDVWNNPDIIPQQGTPIAWRAGANMNTTISFSTDVLINGYSLDAGSYGFHVIPQEGSYRLLFAHNDNLWGSYYLDLEEDISLQLDVEATTCPFSEKLDYEFSSFGEDTVEIGLEWADRRLPFTVAVDLKETVISSFRSDLRGINTYHWQAWNDAARWCLEHNTNLEEALSWVNRSIEGGYGGFAANQNIENLITKAEILKALAYDEELKTTIELANHVQFEPYQANQFYKFILANSSKEAAFSFSQKALESYPDVWYIQLNHGISYYVLGEKSTAVELLELARLKAPTHYAEMVLSVINQMQEGSFKLPGE